MLNQPFTSASTLSSTLSFPALIDDEMRMVDDIIRQRLHSDVVLVRQVSEYIINSGGKRLRPALVLLVANALGYSGSRSHQLAAVTELIHTATLLHDDVVDESELRRGEKTANVLFGNAASVLVGDFLYSRAFQIMVDVNNTRVMEVMAQTTNKIAEGEVLQLLNCHNPMLDEAGYFQVILYKTAKLFEAACHIGAIFAETSREMEAAMASYGLHLGVAFQLIDDLLDYSGDSKQTGKRLGDDLMEGKPTLPLIYVMQHGQAEQIHLVKQAIEKGGVDKLEEILKAIHHTQALQYVKRRAEEEARFAYEALEKLPHSKYKQALIELAYFAVTRNY